jgi:hypothetical protein
VSLDSGNLFDLHRLTRSLHVATAALNAADKENAASGVQGYSSVQPGTPSNEGYEMSGGEQKGYQRW